MRLYKTYKRLIFFKAHTGKDKIHSISIHTVENLLIVKNKHIKCFV